VSRGLQRRNRKTGKIVTIYHRELLKKQSRMGTLFTQLVIQGLKVARHLHYKIYRFCALCQECGLDGRWWLFWECHQTSNSWQGFTLDKMCKEYLAPICVSADKTVSCVMNGWLCRSRGAAVARYYYTTITVLLQ